MGLGNLRSELKKSLTKSNKDLIYNAEPVQWITTGDPIFDMIAGGGMPRGRIVEVFGQEHSGKSAIMASTAAGLQQRGGSAIYIDGEHAIDMDFNNRCYGLKLDSKTFEVMQPLYLEEVLDIFDIITKDPSISPDLIILDSIAGCKPKDIVTAAADKEARLGMHAKMMGLLMEKAKLLCSTRNMVFAMTNQLRGAIGTSRFEQNQGTGSGFNPMETYTTPGGFAPRYYASCRMRLEYGGNVKGSIFNPMSGETEEIRVANEIKVLNIKNKCATPFLKGKTRFDFPFSTQKGGWNAGLAMLDVLEAIGVVSYSGTKMSYKSDHKEWSMGGVKRDTAKAEFAKQPELVADALSVLKGLYKKAMDLNLNLRATDEDLADVRGAMAESEDELVVGGGPIPSIDPMGALRTVTTQVEGAGTGPTRGGGGGNVITPIQPTPPITVATSIPRVLDGNRVPPPVPQTVIIGRPKPVQADVPAEISISLERAT